MDDRRLGASVRLIRTRLRLRQVDLAAAAAVSQSTVSDVERGAIDSMSVATLRGIVAALGATIVLDVRWRGGDLARLIDRDHAAVVHQVVGLLRRGDWTVAVEWSFNHYGERGSVDVVAWHPNRRALAVIEVKSRLTDLQDLLSTLDRKARIAPRLLAVERGWRPESIGKIVIVRDTAASRSIAGRHAAMLAVSLPDGSRRSRRWISEPIGALAGLWFLSDIAKSDSRTVPIDANRVRRRRAGSH